MAHPKPAKRSGYGLYVLFFLVFLAIMAYAAYWLFARAEINNGLQNWIEDQRRAGYSVEYQDLRLDGFPYRFSLEVDAPRYADPQTGSEWQGEILQIVAQSWAPFHAIIRSEGRHEIVLPDGKRIRARLGPKSAASVKWNTSSVTDIGISLDSTELTYADAGLHLEALNAHTAPVKGVPSRQRIAIDWQSLDLEAAQTLLAPFAQGLEIFGSEIGPVQLRLESPVLSLTGASDTRRRPNDRTEIAQFLFNWGPLKLGLKGEYTIDARGQLEGTLKLRLEDTDRLKAVLIEAGLVTEEQAVALDLIAASSRNGGFLTVAIDDNRLKFLGQTLGVIPDEVVEFLKQI